MAKLQKPGAGAPTREPIVDEKTQKVMCQCLRFQSFDVEQEMMAFYYKKQEEAKKLEAESEDAYLNSAWANPKVPPRHITITRALVTCDLTLDAGSQSGAHWNWCSKLEATLNASKPRCLPLADHLYQRASTFPHRS